MMHDSRKSDRPVIPTKPSNNAESSAAEGGEGRGLVKGNTDEQNAPRTQSRVEGAPSALDRVRQRARQDRKAKFTTLFHHLTVDRLRDAYLSLKKRAAPGVDGVTWEQYGEDLEENLLDLHARLHRGAHRARPSRRVYIPKADGRQRPLGKTRLIAFGKFANANRRERQLKGAAETFSFLGFTHICAKTKAGRFLLARHTDKKRMRAKLQEVKAEVQLRRHQPIPEQGRWLGQVVRGYHAYYAVPTNVHTLASFRTQIVRMWHRALRRRGQRDRTDWGRMKDLEQRWIPPARVLHPWPDERFDVRTRGKSPVQ